MPMDSSDQPVFEIIEELETIVIDDWEGDGDFEILEHGPPFRPAGKMNHQNTLMFSSPSSSPSSQSSRTLSPTHSASNSSQGDHSPPQSIFRPLDWGRRAKDGFTFGRAGATSLNSFTSQDSSTSSTSLTQSPSPRSQLRTMKSGTSERPINLDDKDPRMLAPTVNTAGFPEVISLINDDEPDPTSASTPKLRRSQIGHPEVVDLDDDALEELIERSLPVSSVQNTEKSSQGAASKVMVYERRNPSIANIIERRETHTIGTMHLRARKTVELQDGSFLKIKDIIYNTATQEIWLRGHRLQRVKDLNGLLEKKANEVVHYLEVDLDDPRDPMEQGAVEIPLDEVIRTRSLRATNQKFPLCRGTDPGQYQNQQEMYREGTLTLRWKFTCTFASAADRHNNVFKERSLEKLRAGEFPNHHAASESNRRFEWRGETIPGGAYRPKPKPKLDAPGLIATPFYNVIRRVPPRRVRTNTTLQDELDRLLLGIEHSERIRLLPGSKESSLGKRKYDGDEPSSSEQVSKKARHDASSIDQDTTTIHSKAGNQKRNPSTQRGKSTHQNFHPLPQRMNLSNSPLSSPPPTGSIQTPSTTPLPARITRLPGQKLTYGDAFCGAGGTTRGALQAGLHIKWGFDFSPHACSSWRRNFPSAQLYPVPAHEFVALAKKSPDPDLMKVDILHLSPPCQFFSPAHTIDGPNDEMNVASLFAVQTVIEVSRPRVVTLEQTFGIAWSRFRWFFNSLIQMFTAHDFSIRWAVVPFVQWGLPQRRNRLIVIASCPGEILPRIPPPTHRDPSFPPTPSTQHLKPYTSINSTLTLIPRHHISPDHAPDPWPSHKHKKPYDGSKHMPRAMTTSGGENYHPSGTRDFTLREYACLQGFPLQHVFDGNERKRQIGNAVPPVVAKVLFESLRRDLDRADGVVDEVVEID